MPPRSSPTGSLSSLRCSTPSFPFFMKEAPMKSKSRSDSSSRNFKQWLRAYRKRNSGSHLFDYPSPDGTLSSFWFWSPLGAYRWPERQKPEEQLLVAKVFLTLLGRLQTEKPFMIDFYGGQLNAANLLTGQILLDGTVLLDPEGRSFTERLDILAGLALHEIAHLKFTDPELKMKALARSKIFYLVLMIIEDERIEYRLGREAPGFVDFLQRTKDYMFREQIAKLPAPEPQEEYQELLGALLLFVRYPPSLTREMLTKWQKELEFAGEVLTPFPDTDERVWQATERIVERLFKEREEEEQRERAKAEQGKQSLPIPMPGAGGEIPPPRNTEEFIERMADHLIFEGAVEEGMLQRLWRLEQTMTSGRRGLPFPFPFPQRLGPFDPSGPVRFSEAPENRGAYLQDLRVVKPYIQPLKRSLRFREAVHKEILRRREEGRLEGRMLYAAPLGEEKVFKQVKEERRRRTVVILVMDESGSMAGEKIERARQTAVLFKEALEQMRSVDLYIYGHAADIGQPNITQIFRYYSPRGRRRFSLGSAKARGNNRDGVALEAIGQEVLKKTAEEAEEIVMLVISDGMPAA
ncbi:TPA: hypothetical protein EYP12_02765, partial [Candidatus Bipolaricaulota bacterium]|nr:hypothetical protein [Candidatus Bipolaricaulota bacterium]